MSGIRWFLGSMLASALLTPALSADAITARHDPVEKGCIGKYSDKKFAAAKAKLDDPKKTRAGVIAMRNNGDEGCAALVEWMNAGAPGGGENLVEDVVGWIGRSTAEGALEAVLAATASEHEEAREEAVKVLDERLVELTADEVATLVDSEDAEIRKGAVAILAGHCSIGQVERVETAGGFGPTILLWVEEQFYGHPDPPSAAHMAGLEKLVGDKQDMVREHCGRVMGRMLKEKLGTDPSYGTHLVTLIGDAEEDTAETSAYGAGWGCPPNAAEIVAAVVTANATHDEVAEEFMDSFDELVDEFDPDESALAMADAIIAGGNSSMKKDAEKMKKKIEKKIKRRK